MPEAFATMRGSDLLVYVRDRLLKLRADKLSYAEHAATVEGITALNSEALLELGALGAACEAIQFAIAAGQEATVRGRAAPDWLLKMIAQLRVSLMSDGETTEAEA
jgi:hypothetical protein